MGINETIAAAAAAQHDLVGESITYHSAALGDLSVKGVPDAGPLGPRMTDERRANVMKVTISLAKSDVASVAPNTDYATVPGVWFDSSEATVRKRVSKILGDRSTADAWVVELS